MFTLQSFNNMQAASHKYFQCHHCCIIISRQTGFSATYTNYAPPKMVPWQNLYFPWQWYLKPHKKKRNLSTHKIDSFWQLGVYSKWCQFILYSNGAVYQLVYVGTPCGHFYPLGCAFSLQGKKKSIFCSVFISPFSTCTPETYHYSRMQASTISSPCTCYPSQQSPTCAAFTTLSTVSGQFKKGTTSFNACAHSTVTLTYEWLENKQHFKHQEIK